MDWPTLRRLHAEGLEIGGHTLTHPALTRIGPDQLTAELQRGKAMLEESMSAAITSFAYPFGFNDSLVRNAVEAAGYATAVAIEPGYAVYGDDPLLLPRITVSGEDGLAAFTGKLDRREPAPLLWRLRSTRARRRGVDVWRGR